MTCKTYWEKPRAFQLQDSTVQKIFKVALPEKSEKHQGSKKEKACKGNTKGARHPLSYPSPIYQHPCLALQRMQSHLYYHTVIVLKQAEVESKETQWLNLPKRKSLYQTPTSQLESRIPLFYYSKFARFMKIGKYPFPQMSDIVEPPVFLIWPQKNY